MAQEEQVLVIKRTVIEHLGIFNGLRFDTERYIKEIFIPGVPCFIPRVKAEKDPSYKQIIPYVIMAYNGKYLSYVRGKRAGETRLAGNRSIGIGGHINPSDDLPLFNANFFNTYLAAVEREVAEEISVKTTHSNHIVALLNDDSNEVGSVHLGIVHYWALDAPDVQKREQMITQMAFMAASELLEVRDTLETWSQLCVSHLAEIENSRLSRLPLPK